jgi:DNA-binding GntR family transcriptional regulator
MTLPRASVPELLADELRRRILDGEPPVGAPLRELDLAERYEVSRHTLRAALRLLAAEGLVEIEPNRGARVARLDRDRLVGLFELRTALEVEAARLALERHDGDLPPSVERAVDRLVEVCARGSGWRAVSRAHEGVHRAIVTAGGSERITAAYDALATELLLFLLQLEPAWPLERMAQHHVELVHALRDQGAESLRPHLRDGLVSVLALVPG